MRTHTHTHSQRDRQTDRHDEKSCGKGRVTYPLHTEGKLRFTGAQQCYPVLHHRKVSEQEKDGPHLPTEPLSVSGLETSSQAVRRAAARHTE